MVAPICILINSAWEFPFLHTLPMLISYLFDDSHSDKSEVITHGFELICLMISGVEHFSCVGHPYVFLGKMSIHVLYPFLIRWFDFGILSCVSSSCILDINPILDISLANIFFHSVGCLFILLMVSFVM